MFVMVSTSLYFHFTQRARFQARWLNLIHILSAAALCVVFGVENAIQPHFPCFLDLWFYNILGFLWVFSFIARGLRFFFQYEYHQAKLQAPNLDSQVKDSKNPGGLDNFSVKAPHSSGFGQADNDGQGSGNDNGTSIITMSVGTQRKWVPELSSSSTILAHGGDPGQGPGSHSDSQHQSSPPSLVVVPPVHPIHWWDGLRFNAVMQRIPWVRRRKIFSEQYLIRALLVLLCILFVYLVFIQTFSAQFTIEPMVTECSAVAEFTILYFIMAVHFFAASPLFLFWAWGMDEAYGLRREIISEIVLGVLCFPLFLVFTRIHGQLQRYFMGNMFLFIGFFFVHVVVVVFPLFFGQNWVYLRKACMPSEHDPRSGDMVFVGKFKKKPSLNPQDLANTGLQSFMSARKPDDTCTDLMTFQSHGFTEILQDPNQFELFKKTAAKCFSSELTLFLEDYQCLKYHTLTVLQRAYEKAQRKVGEVEQSVQTTPLSIVPSPTVEEFILSSESPPMPAMLGPNTHFAPYTMPSAKPSGPLMRLLSLGRSASIFTRKREFNCSYRQAKKFGDKDATGSCVTIVKTLEQLDWAIVALDWVTQTDACSVSKGKTKNQDDTVGGVTTNAPTDRSVSNDPLMESGKNGNNGDNGKDDEAAIHAIQTANCRSPKSDREELFAPGKRFTWSDDSHDPTTSTSSATGSNSLPESPIDKVCIASDLPTNTNDDGDDDSDIDDWPQTSSFVRTSPSTVSNTKSISGSKVPYKLHTLYYNFYQRYIVPDSDFAVNLPDRVVQALHQVMQHRTYKLDMFDMAHREVLNMLFENVYPNHLKTPAKR
ncbi:hypothetical protein IWQ61_009496 [Dispira simplex]|nr:hypothetical protein IWQ61_009496 [Dispira simplex]